MLGVDRETGLAVAPGPFTARGVFEGIRAAVIDKDRSPDWKHDFDDPPSLAMTQMLMPLGPDKLTFDTKG